MKRRDVLTRFAGMIVLAGARPAAFAGAPPPNVPMGWTNVRDFGAKGDGKRDDTAAFQAAILKARKVFVPRGTYLVGDLLLQPDSALLGEGAESMLRQARKAIYAASVNPRDLAPRDSAFNTRGVLLSGIHFIGNCVEDGFAEHRHLLNVNGCSGMIVEDCFFTAFRGDGIYLGSGNKPGHVAHNERVTIRRCAFNGVNGENRNGISIIDGDDVTIEDCAFEACSRPDMPGAIDLEPDENPVHILRNISIRRNRVSRYTGGVGAISLILPIKEFHTPPSGFVIEDNVIDGGDRPGITLKRYGDADASTSALRVVVRRNRVVNTSQPMLVSGMKDVEVTDNTFEDSLGEVILSHPNHGAAFNIRFERNEFTRVGSNSGIALRLNKTRGVTLHGNRFKDFGRAEGGIAVDASQQNPADIDFADNNFESREGSASFALRLNDNSPARAWAGALPNERFVRVEKVQWLGTPFPERSRRRQMPGT
jgi:hypothetical protein